MWTKIGIDMTTISRIEKSMQKENFPAYVFTEDELMEFFYIDKPKYASLRANFAAKEALSKALGTGVRGFSLNEVEVLRDELGAPFMVFYGKAKKLMKNYIVEVSLTHEGDTRMAVVMLY